MITFLNNTISETTRGIIYLCEYNYKLKTIRVLLEIQYKKASDALDAYANTPNPESQLAMGNSKEAFEKELTLLHYRLNDPKWVAGLYDCL